MVFEPLNKVHLREGSRAALCSLDSILIDFPKGSHTTDTTRPTACTNKHTKNRRLFSLPCRKGDLLYAFQAGLLHLHNDNALWFQQAFSRHFLEKYPFTKWLTSFISIKNQWLAGNFDMFSFYIKSIFADICCLWLYYFNLWKWLGQKTTDFFPLFGFF